MAKLSSYILGGWWFCALSACGGDTALSPCDIREPSCQLEVFLAVQDVRGSVWDPWIDPPPIDVISKAQYRAQLIEQRERALQQNGIDYLTEGLKLLQMIDPNRNPDAPIDMMVMSFSALYDGGTHTITIIDQGDTGNQPDEVRTLAHELVHAAQNSAGVFGLLSQHVASMDNAYAVSTLLEGEAELYAHLVDAKQRDISHGAIDWGSFEDRLTDVRLSTFSDRSPYGVATMQIPYPLGGAYSAAAYLAGGPLAVRSIYDAPPRSVAQFMAGRGEPDGGVTPSWTCGLIAPPSGYEMKLADELGALALYSFATRFSPAEIEAWELARLWTGDRFYVYTRPDDQEALAVVWLVRCVDAAAAASLQAALDRLALPEPLQTFLRGDTLQLLATKRPLTEEYTAWMRCDPQ